MTRRIQLLALGLVLLGLAGTTTTTHADTLNRTMYITFSRAVALPGVELTAGTPYTFELANTVSDLSLVRVASKDRRTVYLTAFTIPVSRPATLRQGQVITFGEIVAGKAPRINTWFPEGTGYGRQFMYRD